MMAELVVEMLQNLVDLGNLGKVALKVHHNAHLLEQLDVALVMHHDDSGVNDDANADAVLVGYSVLDVLEAERALPVLGPVLHLVYSWFAHVV